jgi:hypothetical protein
MFLAYFDESGDGGYKNSPTPSFTLGCVLIQDEKWLSALDGMVHFRRFLKSNFGILMSEEVKSQFLVHNKGPLARLKLGDAMKLRIYRQFLRLPAKLGVHVFAIVIEKAKVKSQASVDPREMAWRFALQRLERFGNDESDTMHVLPDHGHGQFIKAKIRKMRRMNLVPSAFVPGQLLARHATNIIEDSSDRRCKESYFIQLADLVAYAAFRHQFPLPTFDGTVWDELGAARVPEVNKIRGGPPGLVAWP